MRFRFRSLPRAAALSITLFMSLFMPLSLSAEGAFASAPEARGEWSRDWLVPGGPFRGIHGLVVAPDGLIYVGSVMGQSVHRVDPATGRTEQLVPAPGGMADDLERADDGTLYFTGFMHGTLSARSPDGEVRVLARGLPGMNSLALDPRGRLFATQVFLGDALYEFDREGKRPPRLVLKDLGGLNGFDFGPDGRLCGPLWFRARIVCFDVDAVAERGASAIETVAEGFKTPAAANFDPDGVLFAIDSATGEVFKIDRAKRTRERVATAPTHLDNLAFGPDGRLFVTNMPDNALYEIDRKTGEVRTIVASALTLPGGIARAGKTLYVADTFALTAVDLETGALHDLHRDPSASGAPTLVAAQGARLATASLHQGVVLLWDAESGAITTRWSALGHPTALAFDASGHVVVATAEGQLIELDPARPEAHRALARDLDLPMGLVRGEREWIVSEAAAGRLLGIADDGSRRVLAKDLAHPEGLAAMRDGRVAVAETGADRVTLVDRATGRTEVIARNLPLGMPDLPGAPAGSFPTGLAASEDGSLLLSSDVDGGVLRLRPAN